MHKICNKSACNFSIESKQAFPSIFKRHMKTRSSRVKQRARNAFKTRGIRVEYRFKTFRLKRSLK
jgi:hypothetical protein